MYQEYAYQEYAARHATVRALEVVPVGSTEHLFVVDGVGVIDATTFGALYGPPEKNGKNGHVENGFEKLKARVVRQAAAAAESAAAVTPAKRASRKHVAEVNGQPVGPASNAIIELIRKAEPLTSGEIIARLKTTPPSVYSQLSVMRERGIVETRVSPEDGIRRNCVVE